MDKIPEVKVLRMAEAVVTSALADTPSSIFAIWHETVAKASWYDPEKECMVCFCLDSKLRTKAWNLVTIGVQNQTLMHAREIFRAAVASGAMFIVLAHNHPSGNPTPSQDDTRSTRAIVQAGKVLGIPLVDHVVIGKPSEAYLHGWASLKMMGFIED